MKTIRLIVVGLCGALAAGSPICASAQTANGQATGNPTTAVADKSTSGNSKTGSVAAPKASRLSWGLEDIVKLSKAGVDETVILTYIHNSGVAYNPTAQDVIQLRDLGVSAQVTATLMQQGSEVRQAATVEAQKQAQATAAAAPAQPAPVYAAPVTYVAPASTVTYIGYPRPVYTYDGYYEPSYYSSYPYYARSYGYYGGFYPRVSFGVNFGHVGFSGFHGGFRGGSHGGFGHGFGGHGGFGHRR